MRVSIVSYFRSCGRAKKDSNTLRVDAFVKKGGISGLVWKEAKYKLCINLYGLFYVF